MIVIWDVVRFVDETLEGTLGPDADISHEAVEVGGGVTLVQVIDSSPSTISSIGHSGDNDLFPLPLDLSIRESGNIARLSGLNFVLVTIPIEETCACPKPLGSLIEPALIICGVKDGKLCICCTQ